MWQCYKGVCRCIVYRRSGKIGRELVNVGLRKGMIECPGLRYQVTSLF
jgi:hypothetical protein